MCVPTITHVHVEVSIFFFELQQAITPSLHIKLSGGTWYITFYFNTCQLHYKVRCAKSHKKSYAHMGNYGRESQVANIDYYAHYSKGCFTNLIYNGHHS